jgi:endogenous inhibitor of DNA gyrase (YacG/DUF329 family)
MSPNENEGRKISEPCPICSKRCADIDLHRWLSGGYAIPAEEADVPDESDSTDTA